MVALVSRNCLYSVCILFGWFKLAVISNKLLYKWNLSATFHSVYTCCAKSFKSLQVYHCALQLFSSLSDLQNCVLFMFLHAIRVDGKSPNILGCGSTSCGHFGNHFIVIIIEYMQKWCRCIGNGVSWAKLPWWFWFEFRLLHALLYHFCICNLSVKNYLLGYPIFHARAKCIRYLRMPLQIKTIKTIGVPCFITTFVYNNVLKKLGPCVKDAFIANYNIYFEYAIKTCIKISIVLKDVVLQ